MLGRSEKSDASSKSKDSSPDDEHAEPWKVLPSRRSEPRRIKAVIPKSIKVVICRMSAIALLAHDNQTHELCNQRGRKLGPIYINLVGVQDRRRSRVVGAGMLHRPLQCFPAAFDSGQESATQAGA